MCNGNKMDPSDFLIGGLAATSAICFTNPLEAIKIRFQLQGELAAHGTYVKPYRSIPHGVTGAYCASPFFMIKTQLQSRASEKIAVGYQHEYTGMLNAFRHILKQRGGVYGLWRGSTALIPRIAVGSSAQIATFGKMKALLRQHNLVTHPLLVSLYAAFTAGSVVALAITPPDVISTRLYNQGLDAHGKGLYYSGWLDCLFKVLRAEKLYGLYKGFWANYLRQAPHSMLVLLLFDVYLSLRDEYCAKAKYL